MTDLQHNSQLLADANFDFHQLLLQHQDTTLGFGSEFRPIADLSTLLSNHPHFQFVKRVLSTGMDYHYHPDRELPESDRLVEMAGQIQRGNHKSVDQDAE
jgi:hypothetical protein